MKHIAACVCDECDCFSTAECLRRCRSNLKHPKDLSKDIEFCCVEVEAYEYGGALEHCQGQTVLVKEKVG